MKLLSLEPESSASANSAIPAKKKMVGGDGFEPSKSVTADLQSAPFGHSGTYPCSVVAYPLSGQFAMELAKGLEPSTC